MLRSSVQIVSYQAAVMLESGKKVDDLLKRFATEMTRNAKRPPALGGCPRLTGNLSRTIDWAALDDFVYIVFTVMGYGGYVELGTIHMEANPYLRRAYEKTVLETKALG